MSEPHDPITHHIVAEHQAGTLGPSARLLYRMPYAPALVGVAMMLAGVTLAGTQALAWRAMPSEPIEVHGDLLPSHTGAWVRWHVGAPSGGAPLVTDSYTYLPVSQPRGTLVWVAVDDRTRLEEVETGVVKPARRRVLEELEAHRPATSHRVLWAHAGPGNALGLVGLGIVFTGLGAFVTLWFTVVGRRVHHALHSN